MQREHRQDGPLLAGAQLDQPVVATYLDRP
jgi:hypothetical protein